MDALEQGRELLVEEPSFKAIRTERYMNAEHHSGAREVYDLQRDPFELMSRHADLAYPSASRNSSRPTCTTCRPAPIPAAASIPRPKV
jgi:hypothetical protein